jgi:uncharacterized protein YukE
MTMSYYKLTDQGMRALSAILGQISSEICKVAEYEFNEAEKARSQGFNVNPTLIVGVNEYVLKMEWFNAT